MISLKIDVLFGAHARPNNTKAEYMSKSPCLLNWKHSDIRYVVCSCVCVCYCDYSYVYNDNNVL